MGLRFKDVALGVVFGAGVIVPAHAQTVIVSDGQTVGAQILAVDGDTGLVERGGSVITNAAAVESFSLLGSGQSLLIEQGGTIASTGDLSFPIFSQGLGNVIDNAGLVTAGGDSAVGIGILGDGTTVRNSGTIRVQGPNFHVGVASSGAGSDISNSGTIETVSPGSIGILAAGAGAKISNSGVINAKAPGSFGVFSDALDATISNSGAIVADGPGGTALVANRDRAIIRNSGALYADLLSAAVIVNGDDSVLELAAGSRVQGDILFTGTGDSLVLGRGLNAALSMTAWPDFVDTSGMPAVVVGDTIATVEPAGLLTQSSGAAELGTAVQRAIQDRSARSRSRALWMQGVGSSSSSEISGVELHTALAGLLVGADTDIASVLRLGAFGGLAATKSELGPGSQRSSADHLVAGLYGDLESGDSFSSLVLALGTTHAASKRSVANNTVLSGLEVAEAEVDGRFINPSITLGQHVDLGQFILTPTVTASYNAIFLDGFTEQGSIAGFGSGKRRVDHANFRAQLLVSTQPMDFNSGSSLADFRVGLDAGLRRQNAISDASLMGQGITVPRLTERDLRVFAGLGFNYVSQLGLTFRASGEAGVDRSGEISAAGRIGAIAEFGNSDSSAAQ